MNGTAERLIQTIFSKARCLMVDSGLPPGFNGEALKCAAYIHNVSAFNDKQTRAEKFFGEPFFIHQLRRFGCIAYVRTTNAPKLNARARRGIMVGYEPNQAAYRIWVPEIRKIIISKDVIFNEDQISKQCNDNEASRSLIVTAVVKNEDGENLSG